MKPLETPETTVAAAAGEPPRSDRFPSGIPFIVGNEAAERFSYYGLRAILWVYLGSLYLGFVPKESASAEAVAAAEEKATEIQHLFMAGAYAFPMIGAILADRLLGKYPVILWVSLLYCVGHGLLAIAGRHEWGVYAGLAFIAMGAGGIKPCVGANVGDQFTPANGHLVGKVFQIFYFSINFGSFFATMLIPVLRDRFNPEIAFGVPGILMGIATLVFWLGRNRFVKIAPQPGGKLGLLDFFASVLLFVPLPVFVLADWDFRTKILISLSSLTGWFALFSARQRLKEDTGFFSILFYCFRHRRERQPGMSFFEVARPRFGDEAAEGPPAVLKIMGVFLFVSVFWGLFDQHSTTWVKQAEMMDLTLTLPPVTYQFVFAATVTLALYGLCWLMMWVSNRRLPRLMTRLVLGATGLGAAASLVLDLVLKPEWTVLRLSAPQLSALNPLLVMVLIPLMNFGVFLPLEKRGIVVKPLQRMSTGMFLAALSFVASAVLQARIGTLGATGDKVPVLWQLVPYLFLTGAEVLVSITGLEFAYTQAPRTMKSTIMGFWYLLVTLGNVLVAWLAHLQSNLERFFWIFAGLMALAAVSFAVLAYFYRGKTYLQAAR